MTGYVTSGRTRAFMKPMERMIDLPGNIVFVVVFSFSVCT